MHWSVGYVFNRKRRKLGVSLIVNGCCQTRTALATDVTGDTPRPNAIFGLFLRLSMHSSYFPFSIPILSGLGQQELCPPGLVTILDWLPISSACLDHFKCWIHPRQPSAASNFPIQSGRYNSYPFGWQHPSTSNSSSLIEQTDP